MVDEVVLTFAALKIADILLPGSPMEVIERYAPRVREQLEKLIALEREVCAKWIESQRYQLIARESYDGGPPLSTLCDELADGIRSNRHD